MRAPDLHAPRFYSRGIGTLNRGFFKKFKEKYPQYASYSNDILEQLIKKHNDSIWNTVIRERDGVELQGDNGQIFIAMTPASKKKPIAWNKSHKLGIQVYHNNHETDGKMIKICYSNYRTKCRFENKQLWEFTPSRTFARTASAEGRKNWQVYHIKDPHKRIWELLDKRTFKDKSRKRQQEELKEYNEFDLD